MDELSINSARLALAPLAPLAATVLRSSGLSSVATSEILRPFPPVSVMEHPEVSGMPVGTPVVAERQACPGPGAEIDPVLDEMKNNVEGPTRTDR